jgi:hypothetical protein
LKEEQIETCGIYNLDTIQERGYYFDEKPFITEGYRGGI